MMAWWRQNWLALYIGWSLALGLVSIVQLGLDLGRPFPGFADFYDTPANSWRVEIISPVWWPGRVNGTVLPNDVLLEVNGQPYDANVRQIYAAAYAAGSRQVTLTIRRDQT